MVSVPFAGGLPTSAVQRRPREIVKVRSWHANRRGPVAGASGARSHVGLWVSRVPQGDARGGASMFGGRCLS